jgi:hypothetical protein
VRLLALADQAQISLVNQCRGLQLLARPLTGQLLGGQPQQFVIDQRQEPRGGVRVALLNRGQDAGDLAHEV